MYAIIRTGGKQYRVQEGDTLRIASMDAETGSAVVFDDVLLVANNGDVQVNPEGARVEAVVRGHGRDKKIIVFKKRRRKHSQRTKGHRQNFTSVKISSINNGE